MTSISTRITFCFAALAGLILALLSFTIIDLHVLSSSIRDGALVSSLVDYVMEARRQEKNYLLYHNQQDINTALQQIDAALILLNDYRELFTPPCVDHPCANLVANLRDYQSLLTDLIKNNSAPPHLENIRHAGRKITDLAHELSKYERASLAANVIWGGYQIIGSLLIVGIVGTLAVRTITRSVVIPLRELETNLTPIATGQFHKLPLPSRYRELVSLTVAFNRMLSELDRRTRQLFHAEKLASLGILVSGVAHELNNPLSNISTSCQLATEELENNDPQAIRNWLRQIDEQTERARRIVLALMDYARQRPLNLQMVLIQELIDKTLLLVGKHLGRQIIVQYYFPSDLMIWTDIQRLQQILINLLQNAVDAGGPQVTITLTGKIYFEQEFLPGSYRVGKCADFANGQYVLLSIIDNGPGIAAETLPHIFDPFFTTRALGQGMGLGLYIVQEIIQELGGCIAVTSTPGQGAHFAIALPIAEKSND